MLYLIKKNKAYLLATLLIIVYSIAFLLILIMLLDPAEKAFAFDKLQHFSAFSLFSYLVYFLLSYQDKNLFLKIHRTSITIIVGLMVGVSIEIVQLFLPDSSSSIFDVFADFCGVLFTIIIIKYSPKPIKKLKRYGY